MTITCRLCPRTKTVVDTIGNTTATFQELSLKLNQHWVKAHPRELLEIQKTIGILAQEVTAYFAMMSTIDIEADMTSDFVKEKFDEIEKKVLEMLGFSEEEEEGEEEGGDDEDKDLLKEANNDNERLANP